MPNNDPLANAVPVKDPVADAKPANATAKDLEGKKLVGPLRYRDVTEEDARFGLHALPWAAAALGPTGVGASAIVQGIAGIGEEVGTQTIDRIMGRRAENDWHAIAWNGGWNAGFGAMGATSGKLLSEVTGAGERAMQWPVVQQLEQRGAAVTPRIVNEAAKASTDELTSKTMIDTLGLHLGMTEEQSGKMINAYDEGKQVRDSFGKA